MSLAGRLLSKQPCRGVPLPAGTRPAGLSAENVHGAGLQSLAGVSPRGGSQGGRPTSWDLL